MFSEGVTDNNIECVRNRMQTYDEPAVSGVREHWKYVPDEWADGLASVCHAAIGDDVRAVVLFAYGDGELSEQYVSNKDLDLDKLDDMEPREAKSLQQLVVADLVDGQVFDPRPENGGKEAAYLILEQSHTVMMSVALGTSMLCVCVCVCVGVGVGVGVGGCNVGAGAWCRVQRTGMGGLGLEVGGYVLGAVMCGVRNDDGGASCRVLGAVC